MKGIDTTNSGSEHFFIQSYKGIGNSKNFKFKLKKIMKLKRVQNIMLNQIKNGKVVKLIKKIVKLHKYLKVEIPRFNLETSYEFLFGIHLFQDKHHQSMKMKTMHDNWQPESMTASNLPDLGISTAHAHTWYLPYSSMFFLPTSTYIFHHLIWSSKSMYKTYFSLLL